MVTLKTLKSKLDSSNVFYGVLRVVKMTSMAKFNEITKHAKVRDLSLRISIKYLNSFFLTTSMYSYFGIMMNSGKYVFKNVHTISPLITSTSSMVAYVRKSISNSYIHASILNFKNYSGSVYGVRMYSTINNEYSLDLDSNFKFNILREDFNSFKTSFYELLKKFVFIFDFVFEVCKKQFSFPYMLESLGESELSEDSYDSEYITHLYLSYENYFGSKSINLKGGNFYFEIFKRRFTYMDCRLILLMKLIEDIDIFILECSNEDYLYNFRALVVSICSVIRRRLNRFKLLFIRFESYDSALYIFYSKFKYGYTEVKYPLLIFIELLIIVNTVCGLNDTIYSIQISRKYNNLSWPNSIPSCFNDELLRLLTLISKQVEGNTIIKDSLNKFNELLYTLYNKIMHTYDQYCIFLFLDYKDQRCNIEELIDCCVHIVNLLTYLEININYMDRQYKSIMSIMSGVRTVEVYNENLLLTEIFYHLIRLRDASILLKKNVIDIKLLLCGIEESLDSLFITI